MHDNQLEVALHRLQWRLDYLLLLVSTILETEKIIMADLTGLTAQVNATITVEQSAIVLIQGLAAQLAAAGTDPAALQALQDNLLASATQLADAVAANTK